MKKQLKVIITCGIPGSGKSYWAKEYCRTHPEFKRINRDDLRAMIDDSKWSKTREAFIRLSRDMLIKLALSQGYNVIVDETFLIPEGRQQILNTLQLIATDIEQEVDIEIKSFTSVLVDECIARDAKRTGAAHIGEKVIREYYSKYVESTKN